MVVAKRQGMSRRVQGPGVGCHCRLLNKQHSWLNPICIGQAQVEEKTYKRRSQSAFSLSHFLSRMCVCVLFLSFSLPDALLQSLLFESLGWHALTLRGWILLLSSK